MINNTCEYKVNWETHRDFFLFFVDHIMTSIDEKNDLLSYSMSEQITRVIGSVYKSETPEKVFNESLKLIATIYKEDKHDKINTLCKILNTILVKIDDSVITKIIKKPYDFEKYDYNPENIKNARNNVVKCIKNNSLIRYLLKKGDKFYSFPATETAYILFGQEVASSFKTNEDQIKEIDKQTKNNENVIKTEVSIKEEIDLTIPMLINTLDKLQKYRSTYTSDIENIKSHIITNINKNFTYFEQDMLHFHNFLLQCRLLFLQHSITLNELTYNYIMVNNMIILLSNFSNKDILEILDNDKFEEYHQILTANEIIKNYYDL